MDKQNQDGNGKPDKRAPTRARVIANALVEFKSKPQTLADALHDYLGEEGVQTLVDLLTQQTAAVSAN
jgi:hypothetical protein